MMDLLGGQRRVFNSKLKPLEKLLALALLDNWSPSSPEPWPSLSELQRKTGLSRHAVLAAIRGLLAQGAIAVSTRRPTVGGAVVRGAKPTNHYGLTGLMTLPDAGATSARPAPVPDAHQYECTEGTGTRTVPVRHGCRHQCTRGTNTSAGGVP